MPACPNGHDVAHKVAFCHDCGARMTPPKPPHPDRYLYVSIASVLVIVLGLFAIVWILNDGNPSRAATASEAGISICGLAPKQRPTSLALACGSAAASLTDVTWSEWNDRSATGTGTYSSAGSQTSATIVLGGATRTSAGLQFTQMTVTPGGGQAISQRIAVYEAGPSSIGGSARVPLDGRLCAANSGGIAGRFGVVGTHTSCDFADEVRLAYLAAGGHGQDLSVTATSTVTRRTYRNIACSGGIYVTCIGGTDGSARAFFGPFN